MALAELIKEGFGNEENYCCSEKILYGANKAYDLGLSAETLKLSAGFGGGMAIEHACGALTGAVMVLSHMYVKEINHEEGGIIKDLLKEFFANFKEKMGNIECAPLKKDHRTEEEGCTAVIYAAAQVLDEIIAKQGK